jgi:RNA polymerase sigma factor (sigma-70 family)
MRLRDGNAMGENDEVQSSAASMSDAQLVRQIAEGSRDAEHEFVERYQPRVRAMLLARSQNPDLTEDLVQDVLLAGICALRDAQLRESAKLSGFVLSIARNKLNEYFRNSARSPVQLEEPDELPDWNRPSEQADEHKQEAIAMKAIESLEDTDRLILQLTLVEGLKPGVIAQQLSMRPDLVRQRKLRATKQVIKYIEQLSQNDSEATLVLGANR